MLYEVITNSQPTRSGRRFSAGPTRYESWDRPEQTPVPAVEQRYKAGMRVFHPIWEEGMVLNSRIQDDEEIVDIFFENVGLKRVAASLAKLKIQN